MTPLDALLGELAHNAVDFTPRGSEATFAQVLTSLRDNYAQVSRLDPVDLTARASLLLGDVARSFARTFDSRDNEAFFADFTPTEREQILAAAASKSPENPASLGEVVSGGRFLEFAQGKVLVRFVVTHPELFFDGRQWDRAYSVIDYGSTEATEEARGALVRYFEGLLRDVVWLAERDMADLASAPRARLLRAALALELVASDTVPDS